VKNKQIVEFVKTLTVMYL